ncbi:MAG: class I SAM-dependent methyltransferase [Rhodospirillaceae bacterium]|jgi:SAM-dependent methyltransferase|nr:class I SAM-dependent methyltransferase [Rhodospirillaceae bacterium]
MPADRFAWAAESLDVGPSDAILEIGCGHGLAVPLVARQLARGKLLAVDKSPKMIALAAKRNQALVKSGKVAFEVAAVEDMAGDRRRFSRVFAINVNLFWTDPSAGFGAVTNLLRPRGWLYLFYQPPSGAQIDRIAGILSSSLKRHGFVHRRVLVEAASLLCVRAAAPAEK